MRRILMAASAVAFLAASPLYAQGTNATEPLQGPGQPGQPPQPTTMYAAKAANIRAGAGHSYNVIGKLKVNEPIQVVGEVAPGWFQLTTGGFVSASTLSPTPVVVVHRPPITVPPPSAAYYPVGACEPYSRVVNIGGQPNQINGTACKEPDGSWKIVNYGVPTPVVEPAPVYVAPAPLVYAPPPAVIVEHDHYHGGGYYDPYRRY